VYPVSFRSRSRRAAVAVAATVAAFACAPQASAADHGLAAVRMPAASPFHVRNIKVGGGPGQVAVDPKTRTAWVAAGHLVRISEATQRVLAKINVGPNVDFVAVDPGRHAVWTTCNYGLCSLTEVSETTNRMTHQVGGLGTVSGIAVDPRTGVVWVAQVDAAHHNVALAVSETTHRVMSRIRLRFGAGHVVGGITADPQSGTVWVSGVPCDTCSERNFVAQIDEAAHRVVHIYGTTTRGISTSVVTAVDSRRGTAWLASGQLREPSGTIEVVNIARHRVVRTIQTAWVAPEGIAIDPRAGVVVATGGSTPGHPDSVVLLKESTGAQVRKISVGFYPNLLTLDPRTGNVYVPIVFKNVVTQLHL
jgi:DNA-binding beta-propeller fold protein YncE